MSARGQAQETIRRSARASSDPRASRTRAAILAAVDSLAAEGITAPSVSAIVARAGISRSSFYTQFASVPELTDAVFGAALEQIRVGDAAARDAGTLTPFEATRLATERIVEHVWQHRGLYRLGLPTTATAYLQAITAVSRQLQAARCVSAAPTVGVSVEAAATYLAGGMLTLLHAWIAGDLIATDEEITAQLMALLPAWLTQPQHD